MSSKRLDVFLVENGYARSRERAKELINNGSVTVNGQAAKKASLSIDEHSKVKVNDSDLAYVGRGALKLKYAFEKFDIDVNDKCCADIGASTGGFTQVMLENGAKKVYAVDVGHDQLAKELATDKRVVNCEGVNVRELTADFFSEPIEFAAGDLSFISLNLVVPTLKDCIAENAQIILLIKPQFEAGKKALNKKGIVKDKKDHVRVLTQMLELFESCELSVCGLVRSAITGGDGNIEYLAWMKKSETDSISNVFDVRAIVDNAFAELR